MPPETKPIAATPWLYQWISSIADLLNRGVHPPALLQSVANDFLADDAFSAFGLVRQVAGHWELAHWQQSKSSLAVRPDETAMADMAEQFDASTACQCGNVWLVRVGALSLTANGQNEAPGYLWFELAPGKPSPRDDIAAATILLASIYRQSRLRIGLTQRNLSLTKLLQAAAKWQTIDDLDELLEAVAATATEIVGCQRASIFLHQKAKGKLVGRPAIGIPGGSLVVPDNRGIVGEVLNSGEAKIWTRGDDHLSRQNSDIDAETEFETRSLAAVPLMRWRPSTNSDANKQFSQTDQCIGVFEAINCLDGPFTSDDLVTLSDLAVHAAVAIATQSRRERLIRTRDRLIDDAKTGSELIGDHPSMAHLRSQVARIAPTDLSVLIRGENGTGKEILARQVHYQSDRRDGPFIAVNCAAIVETLLESELFGHEKGAFTDASQTRIGKFEAAAGGTLFLDEIGDMTAGGQSKLLRALEAREIVRVGGTETIAVDVRIIAATNQPLESLIRSKTFREDLFFRLAVVSLTLPPLRERGEDVVQLAEHFLRIYAPGAGRQQIELSEDAKRALHNFGWPGNIRQLRNVIERTCYLAEGSKIEPSDLDLPVTSGIAISGNLSGNLAGSISDGFGVAKDQAAVEELSQATKEFQVAHINQTIARCRGNMTRAASALGLHRSNLYRKMRQLDMPASREIENV